jgi:hypothetical protein
MNRFKFFITVSAILLCTDCKKSQDDINSLILGDWQLFQVYEGNWTIVPQTPPQTISFKSNGEYSRAYDGITTCNGTYTFAKNSLKMDPTGCMPIVESEEMIYLLTTDTLTVSNTSISISSYFGRKDKYIKIK